MYIVGMNAPNFKGSMAVISAPVAGVSDSPTRRIAREFGADISVSELISADGIVRKSRKTLRLAHFDNSERPFGIQLFGANPDVMAEAARMVEELEPDFIDLNFGCPVKKIVDKNGGSSVLRNLNLLKEITGKVIKAVEIPVTLKIRSGWDNQSLVYLEVGKIAEDRGAAAITLHPRTRVQSFSGEADWTQIRRLKESITIPVIGNGDIFTAGDAARMFSRTGCDAIMIGRGSFGNPWIFSQIKRHLEKGEPPAQPTASERISTAIRHFQLSIRHFGLPLGVYKMRSRFGWYIKGLPQASRMRAGLVRMLSPEEIIRSLREYLDYILNNKDENGAQPPVFAVGDKLS